MCGAAAFRRRILRDDDARRIVRWSGPPRSRRSGCRPASRQSRPRAPTAPMSCGINGRAWPFADANAHRARPPHDRAGLGILREHVVGRRPSRRARRVASMRSASPASAIAALASSTRLAAHVRDLHLARAGCDAHRREKEDAEGHAERAGEQQQPAGGPHARAERHGRILSAGDLNGKK